MKDAVFISGVTGFIGSNLADRLIEDGRPVVMLSRNPISPPKSGCRIIEGNITEPASFASSLKDCCVLYHCAADISFQKKDFQRSYETNVLGTRNILEAAFKAGVKKVVHLSACAVLGFSLRNDGILDESADPVIEKDNTYAYTKKLAEQVVKEYVEKGLDVSIANIATVYGPGDRKLNSGSVIKSICEGKMRIVPPGGTSFVAVEDLVGGLLLLEEKGGLGERYIFCTENMPYGELVGRIAAAVEAKGPLCAIPRFTYYPALLMAMAIERLSGSSKRRISLMGAQILKEMYGFKYFNSDRARQELGWQPKISLEQAAERALAYYKSEGLF